MAVPTDKDGGFCLVELQALRGLISQKLDPSGGSPIYQGLSPHAVDVSSIVTHFGRLLTQWQGSTKDGVVKKECAFALKELAAAPASRLFSRLQFLIKTHKPPGGISLRPLHCSTLHPFGGWSRVLSRRLAAVTSGFAHLARNTAQLIAQATSWATEPGDVLLKVDVDNFYLEGTHPEMIWALEGIWMDEADQAMGERLTNWMLGNQYVHDALTDTLYQVLQGSGMGCIHSGDLSDMLLYLRAERSFALSPVVRQRFGVRGYVRYRDDIFLCLRGASWHEWLAAFRTALSPTYQCKLEGISHVSLQVLDTRMVFLPSHRGLVVVPYLKPTSIAAPLCSDSAHAPGVHNWPLAEVRRIARNSSRASSFECAKQRLLDRWNLCGLDACTLRAAQASDPFRDARLASQIARVPSRPRVLAKQRLSSRILRAHPVWVRAGLLQVASDVCAKWLLSLCSEGLLPAGFGIGVAWCNPGPPLLLRIRNA